MLFLKNDEAIRRPGKVYFYRFVGMFADSQHDRLAEVGRNFWTVPYKSSTHAGPRTADCSGTCTDSF